MSLPVVSFLFGILLIATAVLGGGFEIKEIKIPKVGAVGRTAALLIGAVFVGIGLQNPNEKVPLQGAERDTSAANHLVGPGAPRRGDSIRRDGAQPAQPEPAPPAPRLVDQEEEAAAPWLGFRGLHGSARLTWTTNANYVADLTTNGEQGTAHVTYVDGYGSTIRVLQDLRLLQSGDLIYYAGSNPRDPNTGQAVSDYYPDNFRVEQVDGGWTFTQTCDSQPVCSPVQTQAQP
ncbi:MAG TPA: hypothetical protein VFQ45_07295 [Longimicrobium sp.]|nr:hypothetical protein [Longimicrobium sp.]